jgi:DNA replication protein DnaC
MQTSTEQQMVTSYFEDGQLDQSKGLLLFGPVGTGKTTAMTPYTQRMWNGSSIQIANLVSMNGRGYLEKYTMHDMYIDDLGREPKVVKSFGDEIHLMHDLIYIRYEAFQRGYKTHITTNLTFSEIEERYGISIADRIKEMTQIIQIKGKSYRAQL